MKVVMVIGLIFLTGFSFSGCANFDHKVRIDTDGTNSLAVSQYSDSRTNLHSPRGMGEADPVKFARAVAMINYSQRLKNITYNVNEAGAVVGYEFDSASSTGKSRPQQIHSQTSLPPSFGYQPIQ
jgi:hypothetical protein